MGVEIGKNFDLDNQVVDYSIASDSAGDYVRVDVSQNLFEGKSIKEMQEIARKFIRDNFKGKILAVSKEGKVYVNKRSSEEYAYPANRRMDESLKESKMRTAPELDNLLSVSQYIEHQEDDGRHPEATGGWDVYLTRFQVGGNMFVGEVKIMITDRGYVFYDITKIRRTTRNGGLTENNSVAASGNPSIDSITDNEISVNSNSMQKEDDYSISPQTSTENSETVDTEDEIYYSYPNEFATNVMQWANSASTKVGDIKIFSVNGEGFALLKATEDGCVELTRGNYKEVKEIEQAYRESTDTIYVHTSMFRNGETRNTANDNSVENGGEYGQGGRHIRGQRVQDDSTRDNEHLRSGDRGESEVDYAIPTAEIDRKEVLTRLANGQITVEEAENILNRQKTQTPIEIADLTEDDANTTPYHSRKKGESDGDETSKFYGSLLESDIFDERFKNEVRTDSFIEKYKSVTNKETLKSAAKELDEGGLSYVSKWWTIKPDKASLIDTAVGFILMDRYQRVGDYESATAAAEKVREFGTAGGQQVQIFSRQSGDGSVIGEIIQVLI